MANWGGISLEALLLAVEKSIQRLEESFSHNISKGYWMNGECVFKPEHADQYTMFLYYLSNQLYIDREERMATLVYYLNRVMNSVNWYYEISLPKHFRCEHPISSVLGRAIYGDYLTIYQGTTIGANYKMGKTIYPTLGDYVTLYANATVLGNSRIGNHVVVAADTFIIDMDVPDCSVVFGNRAEVTFKRYTEEEMVRRYFSGWK